MSRGDLTAAQSAKCALYCNKKLEANEEKCEKTVSIYPNEKLKQWEKILDSNCAKVKGQESVWIDQRRQLLFKVVPGDNQTFALESTKANE